MSTHDRYVFFKAYLDECQREYWSQQEPTGPHKPRLDALKEYLAWRERSRRDIEEGDLREYFEEQLAQREINRQ
jgi:hypothetical protein